MALNSLTIRILDNVSQLDDFNCGIKAMDDFIHSGLANSVRNHYCNLYSVTLDNEIVAMFSLSFDSLELDLDSLEEILDNQSSSNKPNLSSNHSRKPKPQKSLVSIVLLTKKLPPNLLIVSTQLFPACFKSAFNPFA